MAAYINILCTRPELRSPKIEYIGETGKWAWDAYTVLMRVARLISG